MPMMKQITRVLLVLAVLACASSAAAQDQGAGGTPASPAKPPTKGQQGVLQVGEITIVGRVQKPIASVDVSKIQPKLTLAELRQPFLDRIEEAVHKDPF
jgi:hypothetical protein